MRSQDEIAQRIRDIKDDVFGWTTELLMFYLDWEHAREFLVPDAAEKLTEAGETWTTSTDPAGDGRDYVGFAIVKAVDHRGISASRSVDKLATWAWLDGRDDVVAAMDAAGYAQYGAPKLLAYINRYGINLDVVDLPAQDRRVFTRMSQGLHCSDDCREGCGL